ncbi:hypothetical protein ACNHYB_04760 [Isoptericola jiangsuensis]|uniref:hypothetical protein n=1 Tax=Isoptericola jiangsuensis TaxID=548579 RepID=UPI003AACBF38
MPVRAVVLPAAPLLVPGAGGTARPLAATRAAVLEAVGAVRGPDGGPAVTWGVLAPAPRTTWDARRASFAAVGIADRWLPLPGGTGPVAGVPASVALWALAAAAGGDAVSGARVVELATRPGREDHQDRRAAIDHLDRCDGIVVAAGGRPGAAAQGSPGATPVDDVLADLAGAGGWERRVLQVVEEGPHLPGAYEVVVWEGPQRSANQPTPVISNQKRSVRPTRTVGT